MRKNLMAKKRSQAQHFATRLFERFGNLNAIDPFELANRIGSAIRAGNSTIVERQTWRVTLHAVSVLKTPLIVVYDKMRKQVVTVIPPESDLYTTIPKEGLHELEGYY